MPQSLAAIYLHIAFSTKNRRPFLDDPQMRAETHAYLAEIARRLACPAIEIGGTEDHVHLLLRLSRSTTVADCVRDVKKVSSTFVKQRNSEFAWQGGYGAFSVGADRLHHVAAYVRNQEQHHRKMSFQDEFRQLLREHGIEWDERYVWD